MVRAIAYLKSLFGTGKVPSGDDYGDLIDSFWSKTEIGHVDDGSELPPLGKEVYDALKATKAEIVEQIESTVRETVANLLPQLLADYMKREECLDVLNGHTTTLKQWVQNQLADYAKNADVTEAVGKREDAILSEVDSRLLPYAKTADISESYALKTALPDMTLVALKSELPDVSTLVLKSAYTADLASLNTAIAAKATAADVAAAKNEAISSAATSAAQLYELKS